MTEDLRSETLEGGGDGPTLGERLMMAASRRPVVTAIACLVALSVAIAALAVLRRPPSPYSLTVFSTGQGGVALDGPPARKPVRIELRVVLESATGAGGTVTGITGPGVITSTAPGIPALEPGRSSVGLITSTVECGGTTRVDDDYRLTAAVGGTEVSAPLGDASGEWQRLLATACA